MNSHLLAIKAGLSSRETVVFSALCEIVYAGRAETSLAKGERLIVIKQDGTLLVHPPTGSAPINYMKAGSEFSLEVRDAQAVLSGIHIADGEDIQITLYEIHFVHSKKLHDGEKIQLTGHERDMAEMIYANPSLIEPNLKQVSREEQTKYGFIDVLCYDQNNFLVVIECKRFKADLAAVTQLRRYVEKVREAKGIEHVRGILAAPFISDNAKAMLEDWGFSFVSIDPPKFKEKLKKSQSKLSDF